MKTNILNNHIAMLGLGLALALNMSITWTLNEGNQTSASEYPGIELCMYKYKNADFIAPNTDVTCREEYSDGSVLEINFSATETDGTYSTDSSGRAILDKNKMTADKYLAELDKKYATQPQSEKDKEEKIVPATKKEGDLVYKLTAKWRNLNDITEAELCISCFGDTNIEETFSLRNKELTNGSDLMNEITKIVNESEENKEKMVEVAERKDELKKELEAKKEQEKKDKLLCRTTRSGKQWESPEKQFKCLERRASSLSGKKLQLFLDEGLFPVAMNDIIENGGRNLGFFKKLVRGDSFMINLNGPRAATLNNLDHFAADYGQLVQANAQLAGARSPEERNIAQNTINGIKQRINQILSLTDPNGSSSQLDKIRSFVNGGSSPITVMSNVAGIGNHGITSPLLRTDGTSGKLFDRGSANCAVGLNCSASSAIDQQKRYNLRTISRQ